MISETGLLRNASKTFPAHILDALDDAFSNHTSSVYGYEPGIELLNQLQDEDLLSDQVVGAYQAQLVAVFQAAANPAGSPIPSYCCSHHRAKFLEMQGNLPAKVRKYVSTLLELVPEPRILAQLKVREDDLTRCCPARLLSRFIRLDVFMREHLGINKKDVAPAFFEKKVEYLLSALHPLLPPAVRKDALKKELKELRGQIGRYLIIEGIEVGRAYYCPYALVFSTFSEAIDGAGLVRTEAPDNALLMSGLFFDRGHYYIEVKYALESLGGTYVDADFLAGIPSAIEARGFWPFRVDRIRGAALHGHTRNLQTDGRGLPEIVHASVAVSDLEDAVIWGKPTEKFWGEYLSHR